MAKWLLIGPGVLVAAEIVALVLMSDGIGAGPALALLLATCLAGFLVLQWPGRARLERLRLAVAQSGISGLEAGGDAFLTVSAGILLLIPGFITDVCGILLLLPPVRRWIAGRFHRFVQAQQSRATGVVDLQREDWSRIPEQALEDTRGRSDPP